mgnify:CR=1 FL=1
MTSEDIFKESFPQYTQVGGNHYTKFPRERYKIRLSLSTKGRNRRFKKDSALLSIRDEKNK